MIFHLIFSSETGSGLSEILFEYQPKSPNKLGDGGGGSWFTTTCIIYSKQTMYVDITETDAFIDS